MTSHKFAQRFTSLPTMFVKRFQLAEMCTQKNLHNFCGYDTYSNALATITGRLIAQCQKFVTVYSAIY